MKNYILLFCFMITAGMVSAQALKVAANSNVGIGTGTPQAKLHILDGTANAYIKQSSYSGGAATTIDFTGGTSGSFRMGSIDVASNIFNGAVFQAFSNDDGSFPGQFYFDAGSNASSGLFFRTSQNTKMAIIQNGNVGVGTGSPTEKLEVAGNIKYMGGMLSSDKRLKNNIKSFDKGLKEVLQLEPVSFKYNGKGGTKNGDAHIGIIAQNLQKVVPEMVSVYTHKIIEEATLETGYKTVGSEDYLQIADTEIKYLLINAIKDQQEIINDLQNQLNDLKNQLELFAESNDTNNGQNVDLNLVGSSSLGQNSPNPYNSKTEIEYNVLGQSGKINFYTMNGQLIKTVNIGSGSGILSINSSDLPTGTYSYNLVVDDKIITSKKMVVSK